MRRSSMIFPALALFFAFVQSEDGFVVPFLLGNLVFGKKPDGSLNIGINSGIDVNGNGFGRGTNIEVGNGTFNIKDDSNVLVDGKKTGAGAGFGFDEKKGINVDNELNVNGTNIKGGLGKESQFFSGLAALGNHTSTTTTATAKPPK